jgi:hypothetical protein
MGFLAEGAVSILAVAPLIYSTRPRHGEEAAVAFHLGSRTRSNHASKTLDTHAGTLCDSRRFQLWWLMPTEIFPAAEDLKSRLRELRRFL